MIDDDGTIVHTIDLPASRERVFAMFTEPDRLVRWIGLSADLEATPGGTFRFEVAPGQFCEGSYVEVDPPSRLVFTWGWTEPSMNLPPGSSRVEVDLVAHDDGTRLRLRHGQLPGDLRLLHDDGWTRFLARLSAAITGAAPPTYPEESPQERLAQLDAEGGGS